jgi:hypothetical protein
MTTPVAQIGFNQINAELALTPTAQISMNDAAVRTLAGVPTPGTQISMSNLQGKSNLWTGTISAPQSNLNLYTWATTVASPAYPGSGAVQITVAPGIYVWADGASGATTYGMNIPASFPSTVTLVNNGYIMGQGGYNGCAAIVSTPGTTRGPSGAGQPAINISKPVTITNNSYIAGGGGGGGSGAAGGGGGAGGGATANRISTGVGTIVLGGAIGSPGNVGTSYLAAGGGGNPFFNATGAGASGGRILPGTGGAGGTPCFNATTVQGKVGGAGGGGGAFLQARPCTCNRVSGGAGGAGGVAGASGIRSAGTASTSGGGGGWGAAGANASVFTGGTGGQAITLNANSVTWGATGTVYGSVA